MISIPRWTKNTLIFGGAAAWGLMLISCVVANRTMLAPPFVAGARDEIGRLAMSFTRMRKSLVQAMKMLEGAPS